MHNVFCSWGLRIFLSCRRGSSTVCKRQIRYFNTSITLFPTRVIRCMFTTTYLNRNLNTDQAISMVPYRMESHTWFFPSCNPYKGWVCFIFRITSYFCVCK
jgi:hypothetical protein